MLEFLSQNALYIVLAVVLVVWAGIYTYLFRIDKRLARLEQRLDK